MNLIVFDVDGTLLNSTGVDDECYEKALLRAHNISIEGFNWADFKDVTDQGVTEDILRKEFGRAATENEVLQVEKAMGEFVSEQAKTNPEKFDSAPGVRNFIEVIRSKKDIGFCLATGAWEGSARAKLSYLSDLLDLEKIPWQHASQIRRRADIVRASVEKAKTFYGVSQFDSITAFGDGKWDYLTAKELEIEFVGVNLNNSKKLDEYSDAKVIRSYYTLLKLDF